MAAGATWPIGLICCFALLFFLIAASIVLALIPLYLPRHGAGIQRVKNPEQVVYLQYSGTAEDGAAGSPDNLDDINNQLSSQLGLSKDLIKAEGVQVINSPSKRRKRFSLKNSLVRRKRQILSFQILIIVRITFPLTCQSMGCRTRVRGNVQNQIARQSTIILLFVFQQISFVPIRFSLVFVGFFITIPDIFNGPGGGITSAPTTNQISTDAPTTPAATTSVQTSIITTSAQSPTTTATPTTATPTTPLPSTPSTGTTATATTPSPSTPPTGTTAPGTTSSPSTGITATATIPSSSTGITATATIPSSSTGITATATIPSSSTGVTETATVPSPSTPLIGISTTAETITPETTITGSITTDTTTLVATNTVTTTDRDITDIETGTVGPITTDITLTSTSEVPSSTGDFIDTTSNTQIDITSTTTQLGVTSDLIDASSTHQASGATTGTTVQGSDATTRTTIQGSDATTRTTIQGSDATTRTTIQGSDATTGTTVQGSDATTESTSQTSITTATTTDVTGVITTTFETPGLTSDIIDATSTTATSTSTTDTPEMTSDLIDWTGNTIPSSTATGTPEVTGDLIDWTGATTESMTPSTSISTGGQCASDIRQGLQFLSSYGLITIDNYSTTNGVQNRAIICGSFTSTQSGNFGGGVNTNLLPTNFTLQVNGNMVNSNPINIDKGSLGVGTNLSQSITKTSDTQYTVNGRIININQGNQGANVRFDNDLSNTCQSIETSLRALSQRLSQLSNTSGNTIELPGSQPSPAKININAVDSNGISVISLDGDSLLNNDKVQSIEIVISSGVSASLQLVVINLLGTSVSFVHGNIIGTWLQSSEGQSRTIWNIFEATTFNNNNGRGWRGNILAPNAAMTQNGDVKGSVGVKSLTSSAVIDNPLAIVPVCV